MARRLSPSRGRSSLGSGFKASRSSRSFSGGFKPRTSYHYGGYNRHYRPYRRSYFFHSLSLGGKIAYIIFVVILLVLVNIL